MKDEKKAHTVTEHIQNRTKLKLTAECSIKEFSLSRYIVTSEVRLGYDYSELQKLRNDKFAFKKTKSWGILKYF